MPYHAARALAAAVLCPLPARALAAAVLCTLPGCALFFSDDGDGDVFDAAPVTDAEPLPDADGPDASRPPADGGPCEPTIERYATIASPHINENVDPNYPTNPPTSGPHYPRWARWNQTYDDPLLSRGFYVHDLEHGGVVFLYNCPSGCADDLAALQALMAQLPADPLCLAPTRTRALIVRDPLLPAGVPFAAAAWGAAYRAKCFDPNSLQAFYEDYVAHSPEDTCAQGTAP